MELDYYNQHGFQMCYPGAMFPQIQNNEGPVDWMYLVNGINAVGVPFPREVVWESVAESIFAEITPGLKDRRRGCGIISSTLDMEKGISWASLSVIYPLAWHLLSSRPLTYRMRYRTDWRRKRSLTDRLARLRTYSSKKQPEIGKTREPCYVYIIQIRSSGKVFRVYPNPDYGTYNNYVPAHTTHWIPARDQWFELNRKGEEILYFIATREPRSNIEALFTRPASTGDTIANKTNLPQQRPKRWAITV
jgi:hypothetical protein